MIKSCVTITLVSEARGRLFVFWDDLAAGCQTANEQGFDAVEIFALSPNAVLPDQLRSLLEHNELQLAAVGTGAGWVIHRLSLTGADAATRDKAKAFIYSMIDFGGTYGALTGVDLYGAKLLDVYLYNANLTGALGVETTTGSPYYYGNTVLPAGFDAVAQGWRLKPYCEFTPDDACDLADINQMFEAGNLVTGVTASVSTDRLDLVNNDTIDAADITEWLAWAATVNGHGLPYLRGDTEFDRDVDITDFNVLASHFDPTGDGDPYNGPFWNEGNFNGDDNVDITDFNLLAANFAPSGYTTSVIPEPSSVVLLLLGLGCVMFLCCSRS